MSNTATHGADDTMQIGLLMETAQAHQQLADDSLARLRTHTQGLDGVVRDEIRRSFIAECGAVIAEAAKAAEALEHLRLTVTRRFAWSSLLCALLSAGAALLVLARWLPSTHELAAMRAERQQLAGAIEELSRNGGRVELRRCGEQQRLCVHVDRQAPAYGQAADYFIVKGY